MRIDVLEYEFQPARTPLLCAYVQSYPPQLMFFVVSLAAHQRIDYSHLHGAVAEFPPTVKKRFEIEFSIRQAGLRDAGNAVHPAKVRAGS